MGVEQLGRGHRASEGWGARSEPFPVSEPLTGWGCDFLISLDPKATIEVRLALPTGDCFFMSTDPTVSAPCLAPLPFPAHLRSNFQLISEAGAHPLL